MIPPAARRAAKQTPPSVPGAARSGRVGLRNLRKFSSDYADCLDPKEVLPRISLRLIRHNFQG
jgi:hypothetical protein